MVVQPLPGRCNMFEFWLMCIWLLILRWAKTLDITFCADFQLWQLYELLMEQSWEYKIGQIWFSPGPSSGGICMLAVTQLDTSEARMLRIRKVSKYISDALISRNWAKSVWVNWRKKTGNKNVNVFWNISNKIFVWKQDMMHFTV